MIEEFFTASELVDGLETTDRIEKLVSELQKRNDCTNDNINDDLIRQWLVTVNVLVSTKRSDCLLHFVELNGLSFLSKWLHLAQNCSKDSVSNADECLNRVLTLLDRLPISNSQFISSGVAAAAKLLLSYGNAEITKKALLLFESQRMSTDGTSRIDELNPAKDIQSSDSIKQGESGHTEADLNITDTTCTEIALDDLPCDADVPTGMHQAKSSAFGNDSLPGMSSSHSSPLSNSSKHDDRKSSQRAGSGDYVFNLESEDADAGDRSSAYILSQKKAAASEGKSKMTLEYDETDALEVARQVAIEVEREVIDLRERFCGSPDKMRDRGDAGSLDENTSEHAKEAADEMDVCESSDVRQLSESSSSRKEGGSGITDSNFECKKQKPVMNVADAVPDSKSDSSKCGLDLNVEYASGEQEYLDNPDSVNLQTPILVSATKGTSVFPVVPLCFEGEQGWKGSAATSAFRPASPRRTIKKASQSVPVDQESHVQFDLNSDEGGDYANVPISSTDAVPGSSLAHDNSAAAAGPKIAAEMPEFDLNCPCEEGSTSDTHDAERSAISAASSSRLPHARNFDLNDDVQLISSSISFAATTDPSLKLGSAEANPGSSITILGSRIAVGGADHHSPSMPSTLINRHKVDDRVTPPTAVVSMQPYVQMPPFLHGTASYPAALTGVPYHSTFGLPGSIPDPGDYRNAYSIPPPMFSFGPNSGNMGEPPNGFYYFRPVSSANYGTVAAPIELNDRGSFTQMALPGQHFLVDGHGSAAPQPSSFITPAKRKQPEFGWAQLPHS